MIISIQIESSHRAGKFPGVLLAKYSKRKKKEFKINEDVHVFPLFPAVQTAGSHMKRPMLQVQAMIDTVNDHVDVSSVFAEASCTVVFLERVVILITSNLLTRVTCSGVTLFPDSWYNY